MIFQFLNTHHSSEHVLEINEIASLDQFVFCHSIISSSVIVRAENLGTLLKSIHTSLDMNKDVVVYQDESAIQHFDYKSYKGNFSFVHEKFLFLSKPLKNKLLDEKSYSEECSFNSLKKFVSTLK